MRYLALLALFPICCLASGQDRSAHVTYTTRAARASVVLKELGQLAKVELQTSPQMESEVLVISVKDVPLQDVMDRIAAVTSGDWKQEGSIFRLIASGSVRKQEEKEDLARRVANIRKSISDRVAQAKKLADAMAKQMADAAKAANTAAGSKTDTKIKTKTEEEEIDAVSEGGPVGSPDDAAFTSLLLEIDPAVLAQIEAGDRVVFSTDPTRMQRSLGGDAADIINTLIQKHNAALGDNPPDLSEQFAGMDEKQADMIRQMMKKHNSKIGPVAKALFIASNSTMGMFGQLELEIRLYDAKGGVAYSATSSVSLTGEDMFAAMAAAGVEARQIATNGDSDTAVAAPAKPAAPSGKHTPIEYSEDSKALQQAAKGMSSGRFNLSLPQELHQKLFLPSMYDPLSFAETDEAMAYAKSQGKQLIADLPDGDTSMFGLFGDQGIQTVEQYAKTIEKGGNLVSLPDEAYVLLKPSKPAQSRAARLDRLALTSLMQATEDKGIPSLDDLSAYATVAPNPMYGGIGQMYLMLFVPGSVQIGIDGSASWEMLRFYGHLPPEIRASLVNGGRIGLGSLSGPERTSLDKMIYGSSNSLTVDDPQHKPDDDLPSWMKMSMGNESSDYRGEPTEVVPNGLPNDGFLDLQGSSEQFAAPVPGGSASFMAMLGVLGADELALLKMLRTSKGSEQFSAMFPSFPKLRVGDRSVLNFTFHLAPQVSLKQTLKDHHLNKDSSIFSEDNLPADFLKKIAERADALKKSPFASMGGMFGGGPAIHP